MIRLLVAVVAVLFVVSLADAREIKKSPDQARVAKPDQAKVDQVKVVKPDQAKAGRAICHGGLCGVHSVHGVLGVRWERGPVGLLFWPTRRHH